MPKDSSPPPDRLQTTLALVQMPCAPSYDANLDHALGEIARAASDGADVVCLPELFTMAYPCREEDHAQFTLAESIPGPTTTALASAAAEHQVVVVGSIFERRAPGVYHNAAVVIERNGSIVGHYRKTHIPDDPGYYEKFYFAPGDLGFPVCPTSAGNLGIAICWDQWFPEVARLLALAGAEIIFYPTAIGWLQEEKATRGASQQAAWRTMMQSHSIANGLFVAAVNRVGIEGQIEFWGGSFVADPYGVVISQASDPACPERIMAECDRSHIEAARTHWPFLRDRRIDTYDGLLRRFLD